MVVQLVSSLVIFIASILGCGGYFMYMEFRMDCLHYTLRALPWTPTYDGGRTWN